MEHRFETFTALMTNITRSIRRIKSEEMLEFNLKGPHVSCLYYLYTNGSLTAKELCALCEEDKANVSRSLDYLEGEGYVVCRDQTPKRYRSPLQLTEKGREVAIRISDKIERVLRVAGEGVSEENRRIMYESLLQINKNLQEVCEGYAD